MEIITDSGQYSLHEASLLLVGFEAQTDAPVSELDGVGMVG